MGARDGADRVERAERHAILRSLPKVELHRHLEGALRLSTLLELGRKRNLDLPLDSVDTLAPHVTWSEGEPRSLAHFLTKFRADWYSSYHDVERICAEAVDDAAAGGIVHMELRFSPEHLGRHSGLDRLGAMEAVIESGTAAAEEAGIGLKFLVTFVRERFDLDAWKRVIDHAAGLSTKGVVGVDLAGDEFRHPNAEFESIMTRARDTGVLSVTIHAGEGTSASNVASAIRILQADRIGHGISSFEDPDVVRLLVARGVALEICPISNYQTGCVDDLQDHPLLELDRAGVRVTINSDDPTIHGTSLVDDYDVALTRWGIGLDELLRLERNAVKAAFLDPDERATLHDRIERGYSQSRGQGLD